MNCKILCFAVMLTAVNALSQTPQLMILGTAHLNNPGLDLSNMQVADVLTPERQSEVKQLTDAIARFRPTRICVEVTPDNRDAFNAKYAQYKNGTYVLQSDEREQIGMRLAKRFGLAEIDAVNYKDPPPGPEEAYAMDRYATSHNEDEEWREYIDKLQRFARSESALINSHPLLDWYIHANSSQYRFERNREYFALQRWDDNAAHPGALWVGSWHARNLIIVENIRRIARPGDRVLVIFGAGHGYLLDKFARESGNFNVVDTEFYLRRPAGGPHS